MKLLHTITSTFPSQSLGKSPEFEVAVPLRKIGELHVLLMNTGKSLIEIPYGLAVRIPGFHPGGPGSTPGMGKTIVVFSIIFNNNNNNNNINNNNDNGDDNDNGKDK